MESVLDLHLGDFELCQRWPSSTLRTKKSQVCRPREGQTCSLWDRSGCYERLPCPGLLWWCYLQVKSCPQTRKSPALMMTFVFTLESEQHVPFVSFNFCFQFLSPGRNVISLAKNVTTYSEMVLGWDWSPYSLSTLWNSFQRKSSCSSWLPSREKNVLKLSNNRILRTQQWWSSFQSRHGVDRPLTLAYAQTAEESS